MKFLVLVCFLVTVRADGITDHVYIDGVTHQTEVLIKNGSSPFTLAIDYNYNNLYFIYDKQLAILNLNTNKFKHIEGVPSPTSLSVDQETHDLHIGTLQGIYKYKPSTNEAELVSAANVSIWRLYFKEELYYTDYTFFEVSKFNNGHSDKLVNIQSQVYDFLIDDEDVMFYNNEHGLFGQRIDSNDATLFYEWVNVYSLAMDRNNKVYFTYEEGIYEILKHNATYRKVVSIKKPRALAFDKNNNIIYCDGSMIYRLNKIAEGNDTNNDLDHHEQNTDIIYNDNTTNIEQVIEKLDLVNKRTDKLETDLVEMQKSMDRKINDLSQKIDKLVSVSEERKMGSVETFVDKTNGTAPLG